MAQDIYGNTPEMDMRKRWALMQLQQASDSSGVRHPLQAVARALQGFVGGAISNQVEEEDKNQTLAMLKLMPDSGSAPTATAQPAPTTAQPVTPTSQPRGIRNNNPLNIEAGNFTASMPGFSGSDGRFARFNSMDEGVAAAGKLLDVYRDKHGLNTVNGIINRWAPPKENDTRGYAASVAARLGVAPDAPLTPEQRPALINAMALFENGRPIPQGARVPAPVQVAQAGPLTPGSLPAAPGVGGAAAPPAGSVQAQPGLTPQGLPPGFDRAALIKMVEDPATRKLAKAIIQQQVLTQFKPAEYEIKITPEGNAIAVNKKDPSKTYMTPVPGAAQAAVDFDAKKAAATTAATEISKRVATQGMPATSEEAAKVRKEIYDLPSYKNVAQAAPIYKTMLDSAVRNTKASDLNLVYGLGKIFDPGSVVREGEMVMVRNTASLPDWLVGAANSLNGGAALTPETRDAIMREAYSRMQSYKALFDQDVGMYRGIADRNQMRHDDVIPSFGEFPEYVRKKDAPPTATTPAPAPAPAPVQSAPAAVAATGTPKPTKTTKSGVKWSVD